MREFTLRGAAVLGGLLLAATVGAEGPYETTCGIPKRIALSNGGMVTCKYANSEDPINNPGSCYVTWAGPKTATLKPGETVTIQTVNECYLNCNGKGKAGTCGCGISVTVGGVVIRTPTARKS